MKQRIVHVISGFENGGAEAVACRLIAAMPRDAYECHVVAHDPRVPACMDAFRALGAEIHLIPSRKHLFRRMRAEKALFRTLAPAVVHVHTSEWGFLDLRCAKAAKVPVRVQHSHAAQHTKNPFRVFFLFLRFSLGRRNATDYAACGRDAAIRAFGKKAVEKGKVTVIRNGVDIGRYAFAGTAREAVRAEFGFADSDFVCGMAARFSTEKNHLFALKAFASLLSRMPQARLFLLGEGELRHKAEAKAAALGISHAVRFAGVRSDMGRCYAAMDALWMPSRFEGLPLVLVEAQTSGLCCFASDRISAEAAVTDLVTFLPIKRAETWAALALPIPARDRASYAAKVAAAGYGAVNVEALFKLYHI